MESIHLLCDKRKFPLLLRSHTTFMYPISSAVLSVSPPLQRCLLILPWGPPDLSKILVVFSASQLEPASHHSTPPESSALKEKVGQVGWNHRHHFICTQWIFNWKGAWKKALSDFWSIAILSFQITLYLLEKIRENLTLQKDSLRTLFHALLQLLPS